MPGEIDGVGARLDHVAEYDFVDRLAGHAASGKRRLGRRNGEIRCREVRERAAEISKRRAGAGNHDDIGIFHLYSHVASSIPRTLARVPAGTAPRRP